MLQLARSRVRRLERQVNAGGPSLGRLVFLIPDLWTEQGRELFRQHSDLGQLGELVERRPGVVPTFGMVPVWAIIMPASKEVLAMTDEQKTRSWGGTRRGPCGPTGGTGDVMRLATRLRTIEARLRPDDREPRFVIVLEDEAGTWRDGRGNVVDPATVGPWVRVIRLVKSSDGPK